MPKLPTAEDVFGLRDVPRAQVDIKGYDANIISGANINYGKSVEGVGDTLFSTGVSLEDSYLRNKEKALQDRQRIENTVNRLNEARAKSEFYQEQLKIEADHSTRTDYMNFGADASVRLGKVRDKYKGKFTPDAQEFMNVWFDGEIAKSSAKNEIIVNDKQKEERIVSAQISIDNMMDALKYSKDTGQQRDIFNSVRDTLTTLHDNGDLDSQAYYKAMEDKKAQFARTWVETLPADKRVSVINKAISKTGSDIIGDAAKNFNVDEKWLRKVVFLESSGVSSAKRGKYVGLTQMGPAAAKDVGVPDYNKNDAKNLEAAAKYRQLNEKRLEKKLGRKVKDWELYLAHQQGSGGAAKLLLNPDKLAIDTVGERAVTGNGGNKSMTNAEFVARWRDGYKNASEFYFDSSAAKKTGTPIDLLGIEEMKRLADKSIADIIEQYRSDPDALSTMIDNGSFADFTDQQQYDLSIAAAEMSEKKVKADAIIKARSDIDKYFSIIDANENGLLGYSEVLRFRADAGEDQDMLTVADNLLAQMSKPSKESDIDPYEKAVLYVNLNDQFKEIMGDKDNDPVDGITKLLKFNKDFVENIKHLTPAERRKFAAAQSLAASRLKEVQQGNNLFGFGWTRLDKLQDDQLVHAYDRLDMFMDRNKDFDTGDARLSIAEIILDAAEQVASSDEEIIPYKLQRDIADLAIKKYLTKIDPSLEGLDQLPSSIALPDGKVISIGDGMARAQPDSVVKDKEPLQDKYTLKDGTVITLDYIKSAAEKRGQTVEQALSDLRNSGKL